MARATPMALCLVAALAAPVASARALAAQEGGELEPEPGSECCLLLLVPVGARSSAVGGTITARVGPDAVFGNPAGLSGLASSVFIIHHSDVGFGPQIDAFSLLLRPFHSTVGLSYQLFDKGDVAVVDPNRNPIGELSLRAHLLVASFSTAIAGGLSGGVNYKLFQDRIDCTGQCGGEELIATTHGVDLGLRYSPGWEPGLELGVAVTNLGFALQVENAPQSDPLPARLHVGAAYDLLRLIRPDSVLALRASVDLQERVRDPGSPVASVGLELDVQRVVFLRAGYTPGEGLGTGAAVGVALRYDRFDIGVARSFVNSSLEADTEPFQVSFGVNF